MSPRELAPYRVRDLEQPDGSMIYEVVGTRADGKSRDKRRMRSKARAIRLAADLQRQRELELAGLGEVVAVETSLDTLFEDYLDDLAVGATPGYVEATRKELARVAEAIGAKRLGDITYQAVQRWQRARARRVAPATVKKEVGKLKTFFRWCVRSQIVPRSPIDSLANVRQKKERPARALTEQEIARGFASMRRLDDEYAARCTATATIEGGSKGRRWSE
ncbi:MAG: hypothetical protein AAGB93_00475, partial [Planctomycetota bacterium]